MTSPGMTIQDITGSASLTLRYKSTVADQLRQVVLSDRVPLQKIYIREVLLHIQ
jgi:hypothetical protein